MSAPRPSLTEGEIPVSATAADHPFVRVRVAALMSHPIVTVAPEATLWQARATMSAHGVHHLLVSDRGRVVAVLSDRDIAHRLGPAAARGRGSRHEAEAMERRVLQVATFDMVTIAAEASVEEAAALILERGISGLPVMDGRGECVGIVTSRDLLRGLLACVLPQAA